MGSKNAPTPPPSSMSSPSTGNMTNNLLLLLFGSDGGRGGAGVNGSCAGESADTPGAVYTRIGVAAGDRTGVGGAAEDAPSERLSERG